MRPSGSQDQLLLRRKFNSDKLQNFGWSVSRPTVTLVTLACVSFHYFLFFLPAFLFIFHFFFGSTRKIFQKEIKKLIKNKKNITKEKKNQKQTKISKSKQKKEKKKGPPKGTPPQTAQKQVFFFRRRNRSTIEANKKTNPWTLKVTLRPSGHLCNICVSLCGFPLETANCVRCRCFCVFCSWSWSNFIERFATFSRPSVLSLGCAKSFVPVSTRPRRAQRCSLPFRPPWFGTTASW